MADPDEILLDAGLSSEVLGLPKLKNAATVLRILHKGHHGARCSLCDHARAPLKAHMRMTQTNVLDRDNLVFGRNGPPDNIFRRLKVSREIKKEPFNAEEELLKLLEQNLGRSRSSTVSLNHSRLYGSRYRCNGDIRTPDMVSSLSGLDSSPVDIVSKRNSPAGVVSLPDFRNHPVLRGKKSAETDRSQIQHFFGNLMWSEAMVARFPSDDRLWKPGPSSKKQSRRDRGRNKTGSRSSSPPIKAKVHQKVFETGRKKRKPAEKSPTWYDRQSAAAAAAAEGDYLGADFNQSGVLEDTVAHDLRLDSPKAEDGPRRWMTVGSESEGKNHPRSLNTIGSQRNMQSCLRRPEKDAAVSDLDARIARYLMDVRKLKNKSKTPQ